MDDFTTQPRYVVVREYSKASAIKTLWQPLTRPLWKDEVERWQEFFEEKELKKRRAQQRKIFVVQTN